MVGSQADLKVDPIKMNEVLLLNVNGGKTIGFVHDLGKGIAHCKLKLPICANAGDKVVVSRRIDARFRLIGYAIIKE